MVPEDGVVLAGSGPLMLLIAWQYLQAGVKIRAMLDTAASGNFIKALRHFPKALSAIDYLWKGLRLKISIRQASIPYFKAVTDLRADGDARLQSVSFSSGGKQHRIETELLLLHQGVIPELHMAQAAGCEIIWSEAQQCWHPRIDAWGETSQAGVFIAGDGAGISGARAANLSGQIAGLKVAQQLGLIEESQLSKLARPIRAAWQRHNAIRPFLDALYRVADIYLTPLDDTMVCRCEEISAGQIRAVIALGCIGPNQAKVFTRCGMGPCQGRLCASSVEQIFAGERCQSVAEIGRLSVRPPLKPITLGELAGSGL
jgi:hypothetical protein